MGLTSSLSDLEKLAGSLARGGNYNVALASRCDMLDYLLAEIGQENLDVFKAITVSARVKYSVGLYTNSFRAFSGAA